MKADAYELRALHGTCVHSRLRVESLARGIQGCSLSGLVLPSCRALPYRVLFSLGFFFPIGVLLRPVGHFPLGALCHSGPSPCCRAHPKALLSCQLFSAAVAPYLSSLHVFALDLISYLESMVLLLLASLSFSPFSDVPLSDLSKVGCWVSMELEGRWGSIHSV